MTSDDGHALVLNILARIHAKRNLGYGGMKKLAVDAASRAPEGADREDIEKRLVQFLLNGTQLRGPAEDLLIAELTDAFVDLKPVSGQSLLEILSAMTDEKRSLDQSQREFLAQYQGTEFVAKSMRSLRVDNGDRDEAALFASIAKGKHIARLFGLTGLAFDENPRDITPVYPRLVKRKHYSFIRRSSGEGSHLVAHGLKFDRHQKFDGYMFFSEKYVRHDNQGAAKGQRESYGTAFVDGDSLYGMGRPQESGDLTILIAQTPKFDDIDWFDAMMITNNSVNARIVARGLCLPQTDEESKQQVTGFSPDFAALMARLTDPHHRDIAAEWHADPSRSGLLRL